jgi:streptomycin 6-kinase
VDIFAMVSQNTTTNTTSILPVHDARFLRYQGVLAKMSAHDSSNQAQHATNETILSASEGWISGDEEAEEMKSCKAVKSDGIGPLLGGFADADSAIE